MAFDKESATNDKPISLGPEQIELVRQGEESLATERQYSQEEVRENARRRTRTWLTEDQSHSA